MRILVVDDNRVLLNELVRSLRAQAFVVDFANNGEEGLYKARNWPFDLIILNLVLPDISGLDVLTRIREDAETPVILLAASDHLGDKVHALNLGADDYIVKPFVLEELLARIRSVFRRSKSHAHSDLEFGDVLINASSGEVLRGGEEVWLTNMEYAILMKLAMEAGRIISSSELLDAVLDENDDSMSNTLNVHLFNIRKKLGKDIIQTIRGRGYRIRIRQCVPK